MKALTLAVVALFIWSPAFGDALDLSQPPFDNHKWIGQWGTTQPRPADIAGRQALLLPCNFAAAKPDRATWDRALRFSLAGYEGISFEIWCKDPSSITGMTLYLQSGKGWYVGRFAPPRAGQWSNVSLRKDDFGTEGTPDGWSQIQTMRLSAWRGGETDTELAIRNFQRIEFSGDVFVVRNESALSTHPGEARSIEQFTRNVVTALRRTGIECSVISDNDLGRPGLKLPPLVMLPHNPAVSAEAVALLVKHVEGGGKVMGFYSMPRPLAQACGFESGRFMQSGPEKRFSQIVPRPDAPKGFPAAIAQKSWNINSARPIAGHPARPRVIASWHDAAGQDSGEPALLLSDRGALMTHVLLDDDPQNQSRMLASVVSALAPTAIENAAARAAREVFQSGPYDLSRDLDQRLARLTGVDGDRLLAKLRDGQAAIRDIDAFARQGLEGIEKVSALRRVLLEIYCRTEASAPGEFRGWWCHNAMGPSARMDWDAAIKALADGGCNAIVPNMLWAGLAYYDSAILPVAPEVAEKGDQIKLCLDACKKYNVQCHVWKVNWNLGHRAPRQFVAGLRNEGRLQAKFDGTVNEQWLCPSDPANRKLEIDSMVEVARKYAVDGIHFDYIRYPGEEGCYCARCREQFEGRIGKKVANWPADVRKALRDPWNQFRRDNITAVVEAVSREARKVRPGIKISAAVFGNWSVDRDTVAQDWKLWCEKGYLDFVCPMDYTPHDSGFESLVKNQVQWAGKVPVYPGIGLSVWSDRHDLPGLIEKIKIARQAGCKGWMVFELGADQAQQVLPMMKLGVTR